MWMPKFLPLAAAVVVATLAGAEGAAEPFDVTLALAGDSALGQQGNGNVGSHNVGSHTMGLRGAARQERSRASASGRGSVSAASVQSLREKEDHKGQPHASGGLPGVSNVVLKNEDRGELQGASIGATTSDLELQRSAQIKPPQPAVRPFDVTLNVDRADGHTHDAKAESKPADLALADVSILGLQRSATVVRGRRAPAATAKVETTPAELSLADVSVLGLQRSAKVIRRQPALAAAATAEPADLALADVSVLGLQRSAKVVRGRRATAATAKVEATPAELSLADGSVTRQRLPAAPVAEPQWSLQKVTWTEQDVEAEVAEM